MNKTPFRYTLFAGMLRVVEAHLGILMFFLMVSLALTPLRTYGIISALLSIFGAVLSVVIFYNTGTGIAKDEKKPYVQVTPKLWRGLLVSVLLILLDIAILLLYRHGWSLGATELGPDTVFGMVFNTVTVMWFSPLEKLAQISQGSVSPIGYLILLGTPLVSTFLGYLAEMRGFSFSKKLRSFIYEEDK